MLNWNYRNLNTFCKHTTEKWLWKENFRFSVLKAPKKLLVEQAFKKKMVYFIKITNCPLVYIIAIHPDLLITANLRQVVLRDDNIITLDGI